MLSVLYSFLSLICAPASAVSPSATLLFVGDAMQHQSQLDKARELGNGSYNFSDYYTLISPEIQEADYAVVNLDVPLGGGKNYSGYPCFSAPDSYAQALIDAGFDMMLTANNHCLDRSDKGARRTLDVLDSLKIDHIGTYRYANERDSLVPFIKNINGFKVAFLNYTYGTNGIQPKEGMEVALIEKDKIKKEIELARAKGAEIVVVAMHWGIEYVLLENNVQRDLANFLVDNGVDLIIGGHPHVIQPMKVVENPVTGKNTLIVYSLGNFVSAMRTADTRGGAMVWATLTRDSIGNAKFDNAKYEILFAAKPEGKRNFRVIPGWIEDSIPKAQKAHWDIFKRGALKVFDTHNINVPRRSSESNS